jgi:UDP:flavonoid glycosyltransferase YjiC (YdhE family)
MLGHELQRRGHRITLGTSSFYSTRVRGAGLDWIQVGNGTQEELVEILRSQASVSDKRARIIAYAQRWVQPQMHTSRRRVEAIIAKTDYVIDNLRMVWKRNGQIVPATSLIYDPPGDLASLAKYATQLVQHHGAILEVVAMNKDLVDPHDLWGPQYHFTGFWKHQNLSQGEPPAELQQFLTDGTSPVVVTMGSMVTFDTSKLLEKVIAALRLAERRGVVVSSWSGFASSGDFPETICCVHEAPYDWLFPQACCVIHHGGCGTVGAVLRAGRPSILLPQITSQENFAHILARENLVPAVFDVDPMNSQELANAIKAATTETKFLEAATKWSSRVRRDPGVQAAADCIDQHANDVGLATG